jgi:hypothetical protein
MLLTFINPWAVISHFSVCKSIWMLNKHWEQNKSKIILLIS